MGHLQDGNTINQKIHESAMYLDEWSLRRSPLPLPERERSREQRRWHPTKNGWRRGRRFWLRPPILENAD
jgi:hypothetical protein